MAKVAKVEMEGVLRLVDGDYWADFMTGGNVRIVSKTDVPRMLATAGLAGDADLSGTKVYMTICCVLPTNDA